MASTRDSNVASGIRIQGYAPENVLVKKDTAALETDTSPVTAQSWRPSSAYSPAEARRPNKRAPMQEIIDARMTSTQTVVIKNLAF